MRVTEKKLKELMYLSLIGEYTYLQLNGNERLICFKGTRPLCPYIVKPICILSDKVASERVLKDRFERFESEIFAEDVNYLNKLNREDSFTLDRRIKLFIGDYYKNYIIFDLYKANMKILNKAGIIDEIQYLGSIKYIDNMRSKAAKENNDHSFSLESDNLFPIE